MNNYTMTKNTSASDISPRVVITNKFSPPMYVYNQYDQNRTEQNKSSVNTSLHYKTKHNLAMYM